MSDNTSHKDEEIDLSQLFTFIGDGIKGFVDFIKNLIFGLLNIFLACLLFLRKHIIKLMIVGGLGGAIGFLLDYIAEPQYEASMVVKPNYESGRQLYKNISFYDELIAQGNTKMLSEVFHISTEEAESLVSFEIQPVINENYLLSTYDEFLSSIDSTIALNFDYESYKDNFPEYSFSQHEIIVVSNSNNVFIKLEKDIVSNVVDNNYFKRLEESEKELLDRNQQYLESSLSEIDSLRSVYKDVLLLEAKKESVQGTSINMGGEKDSSNELKLFSEEQKVNKRLDDLSRSRILQSEILNIVSNFQSVGFEKNSAMDKSMIRLPLVIISLMLLVLIGIELNHYLIGLGKKK